MSEENYENASEHDEGRTKMERGLIMALFLSMLRF